jgi:uncharacterized protein (DUF2384 family)
MQWRKKRGINRVTFSRIANCSERKLATYEKSTDLPPPVQRQLTEARRLLEALSKIVSEGELKTWLETPNPGFDKQRPLDLIAKGQSDLLWEMIHQTRAGTYA